MRFTVSSRGEPVGYVELDAAEVAEGLAVGDLEPLPAYERIRPVLERAIRAMHDSAWRVLEELAPDLRPPDVPSAGAGVEARLISPEWIEVRLPGELRAAEEAQRWLDELDLALRDARGVIVPARVTIDVDTRTEEERLGRPPEPPRVDAIFDPPPRAR